MSDLHDSYITYIRSFYEKNLEESDEHYEILGWENKESQHIRFSILTKNVNINGKNIIDIGCGAADLLKFLTSEGIRNFSYCGVDISEKMLQYASRLFPQIDFHSVNLIEQPDYFPEKSFDILYSSGIFNLKFGDNLNFFKEMFEIFYRITSETIVFNLLSDRSNEKEDKYHYFSKTEIEDFIRTFPLYSIEIVDDYLINDFTVICDKVKR